MSENEATAKRICRQILVEQNTPEWEKKRKGDFGCDIGASEAALCFNFGCCFGKTRTWFYNKRWKDLPDICSPEDARRMQEGNDREPIVLRIYSKMSGRKTIIASRMYRPEDDNENFVKGDDMFFHASLDAEDKYDNLVMEIKSTSSSKSFENLCNGSSPSLRMYWAQVYQQMAVVGAKKAHLVLALFDESENITIRVFEINFEPEIWQWMYSKIRSVAKAIFFSKQTGEEIEIEDWNDDWELPPMNWKEVYKK